MRTTLTFQSVTFGTDHRSVHDNDGTTLNRGVQNPSALSDAAKARVNIAVNHSEFASFNTGGGPATQGSSTMRVQLNQPTDLVKVLGTEAKPDVVENLMKMQPELFVEPAAQQAQAKQVEEAAKAEEATREELNRHPGEIEGYHQHLTGEVNPQNLIGLMVYAQKGETPPTDLLKTIADQLGEPLGVAIDKINLVNQGVQAQFTVLARSMGLDADRAADWLREHRKDSSMAVLQAHYLRRDLQAWTPLLKDYAVATGDGRKR